MPVHTEHHLPMVDLSAWPWLLLLLALAALYAVGYLKQPQGKSWDTRRIWSWYAGLLLAGIALIGPVPRAAHTEFSAHMLGHLLLGMLAPILLVLGAPISLTLRALPLHRARQAVRLLTSRLVRLLTHPIPASMLNIGGLVLLYRTDLYHIVQEQAIVSILVHLHVLAAGYLFTAAMIGVDPVAHRPSYRFRMAVLILALAAHGVLAKSLYVAPPSGVPLEQAESGSQLMYYGGDMVDLVLIIVFCWQWYRATRPRSPSPTLSTVSHPTAARV